VSGPGTTLTYHALFSRALQLSARLHASGVRRGDLVALCLPRSADFVVAALGILTSGAAYLAVDPDQPDARLRYLLEACGAPVLLADNGIAQRAQWRSSLVTIGSESHPAPVQQLDEPAPGAPAYAVYASAAAVTPKAVLVPHAGLLNLIAWHQSAFGLTRADRTTLIANPGCDDSVWEIWPTLTAGASLHIPPDQVKTNPMRLRDWLASHRITICRVPTALAETLISLSWPSTTALRWLLTGGDVLRHRPPAGLPFRLLNTYGACEASVVSTSAVVSAVTPAGSTPNLGAPIDGVTLRVIDKHANVVPDGAEGELLICGDSVALGYLGNPDLTVQKFVCDPCNPAVRAYRTGDLVRINAERTVEFLGRLDGQAPIRHVHLQPQGRSA
jgi:amino acid adenylation domain-containing protein